MLKGRRYRNDTFNITLPELLSVTPSSMEILEHFSEQSIHEMDEWVAEWEDAIKQAKDYFIS